MGAKMLSRVAVLSALICGTFFGVSRAGTGPVIGIVGISVPTTTPYRGVTLQLQALDDLPAYERAVDRIADTGADTILLVPQVQQENGQSCQVYIDARYGPTPQKLGELIDHCREKHLRVGLSPILMLTRPHGAEWRGRLKPASWSDWFDSYRDMLDLYAEVAQAHGVDLFVVGSELISSEQEIDQWTKTIDSVRTRFKGNLTYQANWDHYTTIPFWDQLDAIGMNLYYRLGDGPDVTVDQAEQTWKPLRKSLTDFAAEKKKPLIFLEVGWCSLGNAALDPWDYTRQDLPADEELQRKLYQAFFQTWYAEPALAGFMMFEWTPGEPAAKGYTPQGKPAEKVLREYLAKPAWKIRVRPD